MTPSDFRNWNRSCNFNPPGLKLHFNYLFLHSLVGLHLYDKFLISLFQSFVSSGDYDDEDDYPDLNERLESYKSKSCPDESCCFLKLSTSNSLALAWLNLYKCRLLRNKKPLFKLSVRVILSVLLFHLHFYRISVVCRTVHGIRRRRLGWHW